MHRVQKESLIAVRQFECAIKWANLERELLKFAFDVHALWMDQIYLFRTNLKCIWSKIICRSLKILMAPNKAQWQSLKNDACHNVAQMASFEFQFKWMGSSKDMVAQFLVYSVINHAADCTILLKTKSQLASLARVYWIGTASFVRSQTPSQSFQVKIFDLRCDFEWLFFVTTKINEINSFMQILQFVKHFDSSVHNAFHIYLTCVSMPGSE